MKEILRKIIPGFIWQRLKFFRHLLPSTKSANTGRHQIVHNPDLVYLKKKYNDAWKNETLPRSQAKLTQKQLIANYQDVAPMNALVDIMKKIPLNNPSLLEIGCSSGYYSEVFEKAGMKLTYSGCDYSKPFIDAARARYPKLDFKVSDATSLDYTEKEFDIVISGCCILHIVDYKKAIQEAARVSRGFVIFHRTPVVARRATTYAIKKGYGVEMLEIFFNEDELFEEFRKNNLSVEATNTHATFEVDLLGEPVLMKSYLCVIRKHETKSTAQ